MKILIVGNGAREHALAWKIKQSKKVSRLFVSPGNAGTEQIATNVDLNDIERIVNWSQTNKIDLVVVGPDSYLSEGLVNKLESLDIKVFGPTKEASEIEWSKAFAKEFMQRESIPTARYRAFTSSSDARNYIRNESYPLVIKASGLAFGKGVVIAQSISEAEEAIEQMMDSKIFGESGSEVIIEEYLHGLEISTHAFCDGENVVMFPASQDRKRIFENDTGPNTGGMGTIAPVKEVTKEQLEEIKNKVVLPTVRGLNKMGRTFKGVLFPGIMLTADGPKVIEFNARFGDPETQSYMRILETDLVDIMLSCADGNLDKQELIWSDKYACSIVLASKGYPGKYEKNEEITIKIPLSADVELFHAGTTLKGDRLVSNGGRVLNVTNVGNSLAEALEGAYDAIENVNFEGKQYRKDIGVKRFS